MAHSLLDDENEIRWGEDGFRLNVSEMLRHSFRKSFIYCIQLHLQNYVTRRFRFVIMWYQENISKNLWNSTSSKLNQFDVARNRLRLDSRRWEATIFNRSNHWSEYVTLVKTVIRLFQLIHSDHCEVSSNHDRNSSGCVFFKVILARWRSLIESEGVSKSQSDIKVSF